MADNTTQILTSHRLTDNLEENKHDPIKVIKLSCKANNTTQDNYEQEFERIMQEHENQRICRRDIESDNPNIKNPRENPYFVATNVSKNKYSTIPNASPRNFKKREKNTSTQRSCNTAESSTTSRAEDYPSELNPFAEDEREKGPSTNPFGDSEDERENGPSTNPFGDSDEEQGPRIRLVLPPEPTPRRSVSTTRSNDNKSLRENQDNKDKMPIPLPRTISKSMPSTPNQSPLLRMNRSFRLPGSGSSLPGSNPSAYNSIRRKKKPAPPPPSLSSISVPPQCLTASPTTNRPRKARLAPPPPPPPPPKLDNTKAHQEMSPSKPN